MLVFGLSEPSVLEPLAALQPAIQLTGKPVIFGTLGMTSDLRPALAALQSSTRSRRCWRRRLVLAATSLDGDSRAQWRLAADAKVSRSPRASHGLLEGLFNEDRAKELLADYGVRSPQRRLCEDRQEATGGVRSPAQAGRRQDRRGRRRAQDRGRRRVPGVRDEAALLRALDSIDRIPTSSPGVSSSRKWRRSASS